MILKLLEATDRIHMIKHQKQNVKIEKFNLNFHSNEFFSFEKNTFLIHSFSNQEITFDFFILNQKNEKLMENPE